MAYLFNASRAIFGLPTILKWEAMPDSSLFQLTELAITIVEIRTEAVMQALALNKKQSMAPMPSKRTSAVYNQNRRREHTAGK